MICSVCIYSKRPKRLVDTIISVGATVSDVSNLEFIIRIDDEDTKAYEEHLPLAMGICPIKVVTGKSLGYKCYPDALWEMYQSAKGDWLWHFDDDATMDEESIGWDLKLFEQPLSGVVVLPEIDRLGGSTYRKNSIHPFMWLPNGWWKAVGLDRLDGRNQPFDNYIFRDFQKRTGWKTVYLEGVSTWHQRIKEDPLNLAQNRT